jgi:hypothetical protein
MRSFLKSVSVARATSRKGMASAVAKPIDVRDIHLLNLAVRPDVLIISLPLLLRREPVKNPETIAKVYD